ncbi:adenylate kinase isoenzyme 6 homolog Fap7p [Trichomonascus vanleenenianus]|uniref:nucleoside-triphosphatase n=1 Tax=Trichomonascus vanleenenianus TaxID=2268995 RepID=UPI003ECB1D69
MARKCNIVVTGTPGTGKSSHAQMLADSLEGMTLMTINEIAKERDCITGYDEERKSAIVDEEKVLDAIEDELEQGGLIIDWHVCDIFPERLIDLVVVLRADTNVLYDRLKARGYADNKIEENMDAEIMQVLLEDARESYAEEIVVELQSNTVEDMDSNVERIVGWKEQWDKDNKN